MVRFAPTPSADLSLESLRIALFNYMYAIQTKDSMVVRIEDRDKKQNIEGKDQDILDMLSLFGISYTQLYYQSQNFKYHLQFASTLLDTKKAFICFCSEKELEAKREKAESEGKAYCYDGACEHLSSEEVLNNPKPFVIRMKRPEAAISFTDTIQGKISLEPDAVDAFVIMQADKYPTYNFACACDDMLQGISYIIRSEDHLFDAPRQEFVRKSLGYNQEIQYAHVPSILNDKGQKMSASDDISSVQWLLDQGFMPEAILNYLILLGNPTPYEIFTVQEALTWFDLKAISKSPACFDINKLHLINREHIKRIPDMELSKRIGYACDNIGKLAKLFTEEVSTTREIKQKIDAIFAKKSFYAAFEKESKLLQALILQAPYFEKFDEFQTYLIEKSGIEGEPFFKPLRFWLSGTEHCPELALLYPLIKTYLKEIVR